VFLWLKDGKSGVIHTRFEAAMARVLPILKHEREGREMFKEMHVRESTVAILGVSVGDPMASGGGLLHDSWWS